MGQIFTPHLCDLLLQLRQLGIQLRRLNPVEPPNGRKECRRRCRNQDISPTVTRRRRRTRRIDKVNLGIVVCGCAQPTKDRSQLLGVRRYLSFGGPNIFENGPGIDRQTLQPCPFRKFLLE